MQSKIVEIAGEVLGISKEALSESSSPENIEGWDSVKHVQLLLAIEDRFGLALTDEEIAGVGNLGDIAAIVERHGR